MTVRTDELAADLGPWVDEPDADYTGATIADAIRSALAADR